MDHPFTGAPGIRTQAVPEWAYGRGDARAGSDIDVLIVLDRMDSSWDEIKRTSELRADLSLEYDVTLNTLFVAEEQWKRDDVSVPRAMRREGILVWGWLEEREVEVG